MQHPKAKMNKLNEPLRLESLKKIKESKASPVTGCGGP
jgi:hypothetical protein